MLLIEWCDQSDIRWLITVKTKVIINLQDNHATSHFLTLSIEVQILCIKNEEKQTPYENYTAELLNLFCFICKRILWRIIYSLQCS